MGSGHLDRERRECQCHFTRPRGCQAQEEEIVQSIESQCGRVGYHSLNSLPWGLFFTPLIMKFAK